MASRVENPSKKTLDPNSAYPVLPFSVNCSSWWIPSKKQQLSQSISENATLKFESPSMTYYDAKHLGLQLPDQESSTAQSIDQPHHKCSAIGGPNACHDQCISSESRQDEHYGKIAEIQTKPFILLSNPEFMLNPLQVYTGNPTANPYFVGLWNAHNPLSLNQAQIGSHTTRMSPMRVPLPLGLAKDEPIYVNAKQYHGILRRRQSRAKLEARNKVVKNRKPYLHESRHIHALNRVRGSGGRFLSTKSNESEFNRHDSGTGANSVGSDITSVSNGSMNFGRSDGPISDRGEPRLLQFTGGGLSFGPRLPSRSSFVQ